MDTIREREEQARFLATQDSQTLAQALLDLAERGKSSPVNAGDCRGSAGSPPDTDALR